MSWIDGMNDALDYIEANLAGEIDVSKLAQLAACSEFHFQRMFAFIAGVTVNEYIRRRRLTAAAFDLLQKNSKVLDVALKYGYESPTAFTRAFQSIHGVSPSRVRSEGVNLNAFPRITFSLSVKGEKAMNFRIVNKESFRIAGFATHEAMTMEDCFEKTPLFWRKVTAEGGIQKLRTLFEGKEPKGILGVSTCDGGDYSGYYIAVATEAPALEGMEEYIVPATTYAVFESVGALPEALQKVQQRIITEWLPASGYEYAPAPDIEVYPEGDLSSPNYRCETWLPIIRKN